MLTLCKLFGVNDKNYSIKIKSKKLIDKIDFEREIDFYLLNNDTKYKCEVKLMGKGNPESADAVIARDSAVFIADKLSETNKNQLNSLKVEWVQLREKKGFMKFKKVLEHLKIPHSELKEDLDKKLEEIFKKIF